jgi:hypothetical protein
MSSPRLFKQFFSLGNAANVTTLISTPSSYTLPQSTITVNSTFGFIAASPSNPQIINVVSTNTAFNQAVNNTITYTGISGNMFTGCSGGSGTVSNGSLVTQLSSSPVFDTFWTPPPGVKWVIVTGCGGGGGGGSGASVSSASGLPLFIYAIAGGGGGGQAALTSTHVVPVIPGLQYSISIGLGGVGGTVNSVFNGSPVVSGSNNYGGVAWGNAGSAGQSSLFGSVTFPGGPGGRRGEVLQRVFAANEIDYVSSLNVSGSSPVNSVSSNSSNIDPTTSPYLANPVGSTQYNNSPAFPNPILGGQVVQARVHGIWNPPGLVTSPYTLDQVLNQGIINNSQAVVANSAPPGLSNLWTGGGYGSGGGGGGGTSNNIYSAGGQGGQGAQGIAGYPYATAGSSAVWGGGGGGGGGGEGINFNNTHDGAPGGNGGPGFIEIAWIQ